MEPGFRFYPADHVLTDVYLGGEIAGRPVVSRYIHHGDLYSALPETLVSGRERVRDRDGNVACFLYTPVRYAGKKNRSNKLRRINDNPRKSYWHSEGGKTPLEGSKIGGYVQDFTHAIKDADDRKDRTGWRMKEYGLSTEEHGDSDIVLCKVYHTPRNPSKASRSTTTTTSATTAQDVDPAISSKKRKPVHGDYPEADSMPSARPRLTGEHPPTTTTGREPESVEDELFKMYCQGLDETERNIAAASPSSFFQSVEQEFPSLYPSFHNNVAVTDEAAPPWAPAAQPEEDCYYYVMEQEFPGLHPIALTEEASQPRAPAAQPEEHASIATDHRMDAILGEPNEAHPEPQPDESAPDEVIYGLPCPEFSPEMIRRCSDDMMTPWPSPSSMAMIFGMYYFCNVISAKCPR